MYEEKINPSTIRLEEEEEADDDYPSRIGFNAELSPPERPSHAHSGNELDMSDAIHQLMQERRLIVDNDQLSTRDKLKLLETNRKALVIARGGTVRKTENVVYGILMFGGVVVIILALLTTFAGLPAEVTLSFLGTVLGGTIATIAQKLGKL